MDSDITEIMNEIKDKLILHWNCRGLMELPEVMRIYGNHIQEIYLKWNKLTTLPPWITELCSVTNLYIYGNLIKQLPTELGQMTQLMVLDLSANRLVEVPPCIGYLANLKSLLLNDNSIKRLPVEMCQLHTLEILSLSGNEIVALPEWIGSLPKLKELNVDNNYLRELPNRLTVAPQISMISVCSNRLKYLPLNAFVSSPVINFDANKYLNYFSYPLLLQFASETQTLLTRDSRYSLGYGCYETHCDKNVINTNIRLNVEVGKSKEDTTEVVIQLPRQLLKVHEVSENIPVSLWELALKKVYTGRCKHFLHISTCPLNITVYYEQILKKNKLDFTMHSINCASHNLLINGPISICVNSQCQQPIFTEAWVIIGTGLLSVTTVALCCCKSCASKFTTESCMNTNFHWYCIN